MKTNERPTGIIRTLPSLEPGNSGVTPCKFEDIAAWVMSGGFRDLPRLVMYCEDRGTWTPQSWAEYIGATVKGGAQ